MWVGLCVYVFNLKIALLFTEYQGKNTEDNSREQCIQCCLARGADLHTDLSSRPVVVDEMLSLATEYEGVEVD